MAGDPDAVFVLACRIVRLGWRTAVVPRRPRSLEGVDIVGLGGDQWHARQATWPARVPMLTIWTGIWIGLLESSVKPSCLNRPACRLK